jgi:hypothetical protein
VKSCQHPFICNICFILNMPQHLVAHITTALVVRPERWLACYRALGRAAMLGDVPDMTTRIVLATATATATAATATASSAAPGGWDYAPCSSNEGCRTPSCYSSATPVANSLPSGLIETPITNCWSERFPAPLLTVNPKLHLPRGVLQFFADTGRGGSATNEGIQTQMFKGQICKAVPLRCRCS